MQEVTSTTTSASTGFDQLRSNVLMDISSQSSAFADFMGIVSKTGSSASSGFNPSASVSSAVDAASSALGNPANAPGVGVPASTAANTISNTPASAAANTAVSSTGSPASSGTAASTTASTTASAQSLFPQINAATVVPSLPPLVQSDMASTLATTSSSAVNSALVATATITPKTSASASTLSAKNTPVSRSAFEEAKPTLLKAGLSDREIADLNARVQAGALTWGQLVQSLGGHTTGATKPVALSASDSANLQSLFQKLGFASDVSSSMVKSVAQGDGLKVLSSVANKLSGTADSNSLSLDQTELSTFFKALNVPLDTASQLTQKLGGETTVAGMKDALATMAQAMQDQRAKSAGNDTAIAKSLAQIMEKDVAKHVRDTSASTTTASSSGGGEVRYDLKTQDKDNTSWFDDHDKTLQKSSDQSWRDFLAKTRSDDSSGQQGSSGSGTGSGAGNGAGTNTGTGAGASLSASLRATGQTSAKDALDAALTRAGQSTGATQQTSAATTQRTTAYSTVTAPKVLDQVTQAMLKDLGQGRKQLTVELTPDNLGKVQVMLQVKGKEVSAVISAEDSGTAAMLTSHMDSLKKALQDQGLTVQNMEVQTGLSSGQGQQQAAFNAEQHNQAQQQQDMTHVLSQLRMMRADSSGGAVDLQGAGMQAILADNGLHLIA